MKTVNLARTKRVSVKYNLTIHRYYLFTHFRFKRLMGIYKAYKRQTCTSSASYYPTHSIYNLSFDICADIKVKGMKEKISYQNI